MSESRVKNSYHQCSPDNLCFDLFPCLCYFLELDYLVQAAMFGSAGSCSSSSFVAFSILCYTPDISSFFRWFLWSALHESIAQSHLFTTFLFYFPSALHRSFSDISPILVSNHICNWHITIINNHDLDTPIGTARGNVTDWARTLLQPPPRNQGGPKVYASPFRPSGGLWG